MFHPEKVAHRPELIHPQAWIAPSATVTAHVEVAELASIWFGAVLRGDVEAIRIGAESNVQDLCCLHADHGCPCTLGRRVTIGHRAIVHGAVIEDEVLIGMGAIVLNGAHIGRHSLIGAGSLIAEGKVIPPRSLVLGVPGRVVREVNEQEVARILHAAEHYVEASRAYRQAQASAG